MKILDAVSIHGIATLASAHVKLLGYYREFSQYFVGIPLEGGGGGKHLTYIFPATNRVKSHLNKVQAQGNVSFLNSIKNLILFSFQVIYIIYTIFINPNSTGG